MGLDTARCRIIAGRLRMPGDVIVQRIQAIKEGAFTSRKGLIEKNPNWDQKRDGRLVCLGKLINICERTQFCLVILSRLLDDDWCSSILTHETQHDPEYKQILTVEFETYAKYEFGMSLFTLIEGSFRMFLRSIDEQACNGATASFESVSASLVGPRYLGFPDETRKPAEELLNLVRLIRNLIHNDGVYFDKDGRDVVLPYRERQYRFGHGRRVDFVYWELLLSMADDTMELLTQVISHPKISGQARVLDPFMAQDVE